MEQYINSNVKKLETSLIRRILSKSREIENSINLTIGEPDIETPRIISEKSAEYMLENQLSYAPIGGVLELRKEIAKFYNDTYSSYYNEDNVLVTVGSTEGLSTALKGILNPGDEVIIVKPAYPLYDALLTILDVTPVYIDTTDNNYRVDAKMIEDVITEKTRGVILNYPSNPCGTILSKEEVDKIAEIIKRKDIYLISDEIYSELVFKKGGYYSPGAIEELKENLIIINGFSKSHSMTGWRVGYVLTGKILRDHLVKVSQYTVSTPSTLSQYGAIVALKEAKNIDRNIKVYEERANYVYEAFENLGFDVVKPEGTFYVLMSYKKLSKMDSLEFSLELLEKTGVAVVPGKAFGIEGFIRVACTKNIGVLKEAVKKINDFLEGE